MSVHRKASMGVVSNLLGLQKGEGDDTKLNVLAILCRLAHKVKVDFLVAVKSWLCKLCCGR